MSKEKLFKEFPPVSTEEWEKMIERDLKGADYKEKLKWQTGEGIEVLPFYRKEDRPRTDKPLLPADHHWNICQSIYETEVKAANKAAKKAVTGGADVLAFQLSIQSQEHLSELLQDISLVETGLHFNTVEFSTRLAEMLLNECDERKIDTSKVYGTFGYDPFSTIFKNERFPEDEESITESLKQITVFCKQHLPKMKPLAVNGFAFRESGSTIVQELGYALAAGSEYLALLSENSDRNENSHPPESLSSPSGGIGRFFPPSKGDIYAIHFNFSIAGNYFLEIAKLRAARKLWSQVLKAYKTEKAPMFIRGETATWNKSQEEPYINIIRQTTEAMSAAIGGCDVITVHPFDEKADEFSQRISRNIQLILKEEAYIEKISDSAAGSWYIETLTDKIAEAAWKLFQEVEQQGGLFKSKALQTERG